MSAPTVFLIGSTGLIGKSLMHELAPDHAAGRLHVRVGVHSERSRALVESQGLQAVNFDLDEPAGFDAAMQGAERVFVLRPYTLKHMMHGKLVADAARRVGVQHMVSIGAYGAPGTPWPVIAWNLLVEAYVERVGLGCGMGWTHLQPNYFMDNVLAQRDSSTNTLFNRITVPVSWIASADIAAVAAVVLRDPTPHRGMIYPLASEVASVAQIAGYLSEITGQAHTVGITPREKMMERLQAQGREPEYALALVEYVDAVSRGEVKEIADTFDTVEKLTGRAALGFRDFLASRLLQR